VFPFFVFYDEKGVHISTSPLTSELYTVVTLYQPHLNMAFYPVGEQVSNGALVHIWP